MNPTVSLYILCSIVSHLIVNKLQPMPQGQQQQQQILLPNMNEIPSLRLIRRGHQMELMAQAKVLNDGQDFVDLTIYCEDGVVRAHQMLLAKASPFLMMLFHSNPSYGVDDITLILPEVKTCIVQALIQFVYTGVVVSGEDRFYSIMKLVYALNINASIEAESTTDRATTFTAPLVPPTALGTVMRLPHQAGNLQQIGQFGSTPVQNKGTKGKKRSAKDTSLNNNSPLWGVNNTTAPPSIVAMSLGTGENVDNLPCTLDDEEINTPYPCPHCNKTIKKVMLTSHHFHDH